MNYIRLFCFCFCVLFLSFPGFAVATSAHKRLNLEQIYWYSEYINNCYFRRACDVWRGGWGAGGSRGMGSTCVFKLSFEVKQGSCLLHLLRKIYLYLQYDASNTARAQVTVMWVQNEGMGVGTRVRNELQYQSSTSALAFNLTPHNTVCKCVSVHQTQTCGV